MFIIKNSQLNEHNSVLNAETKLAEPVTKMIYVDILYAVMFPYFLSYIYCHVMDAHIKYSFK